MGVPRSDLIRSPLARTIDRETFIPSYLSLVAAAHVTGGSKIYTERFGISSPDFAILSTLSNHPGSVASEICQIVALDKSVVSRRLRTLMDRDLVALEMDGSQRRLYLTPRGVQVHDEVLPLALKREATMLSGFTDEEIGQLRDFLRRMFLRIPEMNSPEI